VLQPEERKEGGPPKSEGKGRRERKGKKSVGNHWETVQEQQKKGTGIIKGPKTNGKGKKKTNTKDTR